MFRIHSAVCRYRLFMRLCGTSRLDLSERSPCSAFMKATLFLSVVLIRLGELEDFSHRHLRAEDLLKL